MFQLIEKLRQKSDRTKKQVAFLVSFIFVGIIFVIWLSVVFPNFGKSDQTDVSAQKSVSTPLSSFSDTFSSGVKSIGEEFNKIKELISSIPSMATTTPVSYNSTTTAPAGTTTGEQD